MNIRQVEVKSGLPSMLEKLREELESLRAPLPGVLVRKVSAKARVRAIRNAHVARCGTVFFKKNKWGSVVFSPRAGKSFIKKLFLSHKR
mgnify:CR=1 FL=1